MTFEIAGRKIGPGHPCWITAEAGICHNGSEDNLRKMIAVAAEAGCQAVKGQMRTVDVVYSAAELAQPRKGPWGETNGELKRLLELPDAVHARAMRQAESLGMTWSVSPWDVASVADLANLGPAWVKIASASITDLELVGECASLSVPVVMSTGMSDTATIDAAVNVLESRGASYALLHTCSTYPSELKDLHLNRIAWLRERYTGAGAWGYSGHETGVLPSVEAVRLGASIVERHITLDRSMWGSDQAASLEPTGLRVLVRAIREWERWDAETKADVNSAADAVCFAEVAEVIAKQKRNRDAAVLSRGESGPRSVLAVEEAVRKKLRRV